jgi:hypothetical protein
VLAKVKPSSAGSRFNSGHRQIWPHLTDGEPLCKCPLSYTRMTALADRPVVHRVADCIANRIRLAVPQPTEWQHIGNQIDAAMIFARPDFVNVFGRAMSFSFLFTFASTHGGIQSQRARRQGQAHIVSTAIRSPGPARGPAEVGGKPLFRPWFSIDPQPASINPTVNISIVFICAILDCGRDHPIRQSKAIYLRTRPRVLPYWRDSDFWIQTAQSSASFRSVRRIEDCGAGRCTGKRASG